jgi:regulatory protein
MTENIGSPPTKTPHKKTPKRITETYLFNAGQAYLQRFPTSLAHFRTVMIHKIKRSLAYHQKPELNECEKMLGAVTERFLRLGLLNDEAYRKGLIRSYQNKGLSQKMIAQKLALKSLPTQELQTDMEQDEFLSALIFIRRKKLGAYASNKDPQKMLGSLARAGYSYDIAHKVLSLTMDEIEAAQNPIEYALLEK